MWFNFQPVDPTLQYNEENYVKNETDHFMGNQRSRVTIKRAKRYLGADVSSNHNFLTILLYYILKGIEMK